MVAGSGPVAKKNRSLGVNTLWSLGGRQVHQARRVEQLHEPLVGAPRLRRRKVQVLVEHRGQAPFLQLPQAPDDAASPVLKREHTGVSKAESCNRMVKPAELRADRFALPCLSCSG